MLIVKNGNLEHVRQLINQGVDINQRDGSRTGRTPLYVASKFGHSNIVLLLIQHGADINVQTLEEQSSPLHIAIKGRRLSVVHELLTHNANIELQDIHGETPLHFAVRYRLFDVFKELIRCGANIHQKEYLWMDLFSYGIEDVDILI